PRQPLKTHCAYWNSHTDNPAAQRLPLKIVLHLYCQAGHKPACSEFPWRDDTDPHQTESGIFQEWLRRRPSFLHTVAQNPPGTAALMWMDDHPSNRDND